MFEHHDFDLVLNNSDILNTILKVLANSSRRKYLDMISLFFIQTSKDGHRIIRILVPYDLFMIS